MSTLPPEDPTRRLTPASPPPVEREVVYADADAAVPNGVLLDELRALRRWLAVVGAIALAGLGTALYTLLSEDEDGDGRGASRSSVRQLDARVDEVESRLRERATKNSVASVREEQQELGERVDDLSKQAGQGVDADAVEQATEDLRTEIDELEQRVEAAEQAAQQQPDDTP